MSSSLYYRRVVPVKGICLSSDLKFILKKIYDLENGPTTLNSMALDYLHGLNDAGIVDAEKLIAAIEKYDEVEIYLY